MQSFVDVMSDGFERVQYAREDFAVFTCRGRLSAYPNAHILPHWHDDFELICVREGCMRHTVNGEGLELREGQGVFVNSCQIHGMEPSGGGDCAFSSVLVHPGLLGANAHIREAFVRPIARSESFGRLVLRREEDWQREIMDCAHAICALMAGDDPAAELEVMSFAYRISALITRHLPAPSPLAAQTDNRLLSLRRMMGFVQKHYREKISLQDIAAAGGVSVSACCVIFRKNIDQTPMGYLMRYRLEKGMEQLRNPNLTVTEIARAVGFGGASYFTECFRRHLQVTPLQYRKHYGDAWAASGE